MDLFTQRPVSEADGFGPETRNVALPGTRGPDGQPLVVRIRRLPAAMIYMLREDPGPGVDTFVARLEEYRKWAAEALLEPKFNFSSNGSAPGPRWDDLPIAAQMAIAGAVATFTTEGMEEVTATVAAFRGGDATGGTAGGASGGSDAADAVPDGEPPAPVADGAPATGGGP